MVGTLKHGQHGGMEDFRFKHSKQNTHQNLANGLRITPFFRSYTYTCLILVKNVKINLFCLKNLKLNLI